MRHMKRDIMQELLVWKEQPNRKPLVLKGVRQCGKTYILKEFGREYYKDVAYFNFEETRSLSSLFEQDYDVKRILFELGLFLGRTITPGNTLIILDEIQECPRAITALKYFCENAPEYHVACAGEYHVACAGSLLGLAIHENQSFPVGKVDIRTLYPMSFYEFLSATGNEALADYLTSFQQGSSVSELIGGKLRTALKQYYVVGGMPEAVSVWCETGDLEKVEAVQQDILASYELDFAKHAPPSEFPKLSAIWASVPQQLAKPNSKFIFSHVKKGWRSKDLEDALQWLIRAGLVYQVCKVEKPFMPLSSYADATSFKLYLCDVGLLRRLARLPAQVVLDSSGIYTEFKGVMTENYVLGELVKHVDATPYYWVSGNSAEVDFIVQCGAHIVPIEVKAESNVKARSLAEYRKKYAPPVSVKTSMLDEVSGNEVRLIPLYLIGSMETMIQAESKLSEGDNV